MFLKDIWEKVVKGEFVKFASDCLARGDPVEWNCKQLWNLGLYCYQNRNGDTLFLAGLGMMQEVKYSQKMHEHELPAAKNNHRGNSHADILSVLNFPASCTIQTPPHAAASAIKNHSFPTEEAILRTGSNGQPTSLYFCHCSGWESLVRKPPSVKTPSGKKAMR